MDYRNNEELAKAKILEFVWSNNLYEGLKFTNEQILERVIKTAKKHRKDDDFEIWLMCSLKDAYFDDDVPKCSFVWKDDTSMELEDCIEFYHNNGKDWEKAIEQIEEEYGYDECNENEFYFTNAEMKLIVDYIKSKF